MAIDINIRVQARKRSYNQIITISIRHGRSNNQFVYEAS